MDEETAGVIHTGEWRRAAAEEEPGFALLSRRGLVREVDGRLRLHLGVERLPENAGSVAELLEAVGFQRRPGTDVWEHEGRLVRAGERPLEEGARLVWTQPAEGDEEPGR